MTKSYRLYCPIARAAQNLQPRWTVLVMRAVLSGQRTFNEIMEAAPRVSSSTLAKRLRDVEAAGLIQSTIKRSGRLYEPTVAGVDFGRVLAALSDWAEHHHLEFTHTAQLIERRWAILVMRNILWGRRTFNEIKEAAPGVSNGVLARRLGDLEAAGLIQSGTNGRGRVYEATAAGLDFRPVLAALSCWGDEHVDLTHDEADPGDVLWMWFHRYLQKENLPHRRTTVRFEFMRRGRLVMRWVLVEGGDAELCAQPVAQPNDEDLVVEIKDPMAFTKWHLGLLDWELALRGIHVTGPQALRRALPTWNGGPESHGRRREG